MEALVAVAGTLLGALFGGLGTYLTQSAAYRREARERQAVLRRQVYVEWLTQVHHFYTSVQVISGEHRRGTISATDCVLQLRAVRPEAAQVALEHLRLLAGDHGAAQAAVLWAHMRREPVPQGHDRSPAGWRSWREEYWRLRREFIDAARKELGLASLDWETAGVGDGKFAQYQRATPPGGQAKGRSGNPA